jgi:arabinose-5-phosphate isomerase
MRGDAFAEPIETVESKHREISVKLVKPYRAIALRQEAARATIAAQAAAVAALADRLDESYDRAIDLLLGTSGHVVVSGMGKSGHVGRKISATLASTGTPSHFLHPAEAHHGDLGVIRPGDTVILISYSGETQEVISLLPHLQRMHVPVVALIGKRDSTLAREADVVLDAGVDKEVCPLNLTPTNSTLAALALGDALAVSLMRERNFMPRDFARFHPGGSLGRRLLTRVRDTMHRHTLPIVSPTESVGQALIVMTQGRLGIALVMQGDKLEGVISDGDLRRALQVHFDLLNLPSANIMTTQPVTIDENATLVEAEVLMQRKQIKEVVAVDANGRVSGILDIFQTT